MSRPKGSAHMTNLEPPLLFFIPFSSLVFSYLIVSVSLLVFLSVFFFNQMSCSPDWYKIQYVAKNDLEF